MARKTKYRSSQAEYAAQYHVDARTVRRWMAKGYPLDDPQKMASALGAQKNVPESFRDCTDIQEAKLKKVILECERLHLRNQREAGELVPRDQVREDGLRIGSVLTAELAALLNDMPSVLAGLSPVAVREKLHQRIEKLKGNILRELAK